MSHLHICLSEKNLQDQLAKSEMTEHVAVLCFISVGTREVSSREVTECRKGLSEEEESWVL